MSHLRVRIAATRTSIVEPGVHLSQSDVAFHGQTIFFSFGWTLLDGVEVVQMIDGFITDALASLESKEKIGEEEKEIIRLTAPRAGDVLNCGCGRRRFSTAA